MGNLYLGSIDLDRFLPKWTELLFVIKSNGFSTSEWFTVSSRSSL
jgi:hypothetical protein